MRHGAVHVQAPHNKPARNGALDMGRNYIVLDTETTDKVGRKTNQPEPYNALVYDLGFVVVDGKTGVELEAHSYAIADTMLQDRLMRSAYYADKLSAYIAGGTLDTTGKWQVVSFLKAWQSVRDACKRYNIRDIWAYNCSFDELALNATMRTYSNDFRSFFAPHGVRFRDIWDYASCITGTRPYVEWALMHGRTTSSGNPSTSAESVYAYITHNPLYIEEHTALSDARIEAAILAACKRRKKRTRHSRGQGWRDAAKVAKTL